MSDLLIRLAGVVAWLVPGVTAWRAGQGAAYLVPWLALGALFWRSTRSGTPPRLGLAACALEALAAIWLTWNGPGFEGILLVLVAAQLPAFTSPAWAFAACVAQTLLAYGPKGAIATGIAYLGFQVFGLGAQVLVKREARAREDLAAANAELIRTQAKVVAATRETERLRIARELHDSLGHRLTALILQLEAAVHRAGPGERVQVEHARSHARALLDDVRETVSALREDDVERPLAETLAAIASAVPGLEVHLTVPLGLRVADAERVNALLRCVQELASNAVRHGAARNLFIALASDRGRLTLQARDDGKGAAALSPGNGLTGLAERFALLGGALQWRSASGAGVSIEAWLPSTEVAR